MTIERLRASLADRYRIERELGAGGMATVYLQGALSEMVFILNWPEELRRQAAGAAR